MPTIQEFTYDDLSPLLGEHYDLYAIITEAARLSENILNARISALRTLDPYLEFDVLVDTADVLAGFVQRVLAAVPTPPPTAQEEFPFTPATDADLACFHTQKMELFPEDINAACRAEATAQCQ